MLTCVLQLSCLVTAISRSPCSPTNQTCICINGPIQEEVTDCVTASCTIKEALGKSASSVMRAGANVEFVVTKNFTSTTCDAAIRDKGSLYNAISTTFGTISGAVIVLRIGTKFSMKSDQSKLWFDDLFIVITLVSGIPSSVLNVHGLTVNGLGKDIWTVTFKQITDFIHVFYVMEILYFAQVALVKLSILFFYLRIFPATGVRRLIWMTIAVDVMFGTTFVFVAIFQCHPISFYWKRWDGEHSGKCFDGGCSFSHYHSFWVVQELRDTSPPLNTSSTFELRQVPAQSIRKR